MYRIIKVVIFLVCFIILSASSTLSEEQWINYTNTSNISKLTIEGNYLWQGSSGGAVRRNLDDPLNDVFYYTHAKGLGGVGVALIKIDHSGRKWFATKGVTVWDGVNSTTYDTSNSDLISDLTTCITEDSSGRMWIGTYYGLSIFDGISWTNYDTLIIDNGVISLAIDDSGYAWMGTYEYGSTHGVLKFDGSDWVSYDTTNSGIISNWVQDIVIESPDKVWFGCFGGVSVFDGNNWTSYGTSNSDLASSNVRSIAIDSLGRKWFGGCCDGLSMFDGINWVVYDTTNSGLPSNQVISIVVDSTGNLWFATKTIEREPRYNIVKFDGADWMVYDISGNQIADNRVTDIVTDRSGNTWIGTKKKGLCRFDGENWTTYNTGNSGILGNDIVSLALDTSGALWIVCGGGLSKYDGINWTNYDTTNSELAGRSILCLAIDKDDVKWLGTMLYGLIRFDDTSCTFYDTTNSPLPYNWVQSLAVDSSNSLWIGTMGQLSEGLSGWVLKFDGTDWTVYNPSNSGLPYNYGVWSLAVDSLNRIWIGALLAGLAMYDGNDWVTYNTSNSNIASNIVMDIGFDPYGNTWCATEGEVWGEIDGNGWIEGGGVSKFDGINWVTYNSENSGLTLNLVGAVAIDSKGNKWFGTNGAGVSFLGTTSSVVEEPDTPLPRAFALSQNYPNPFNPSTTIPFRVDGLRFIVNSPIHTTLVVYNILGQKVRTLLDEEKLPGNHKVIWDGKDDYGKEVASGIYLYQLRTKDYTDTKKMLLLK